VFHAPNLLPFRFEEQMADAPIWVILYGLATLLGVAWLLKGIRRNTSPRTVLYRRLSDGALERSVVSGITPDQHQALHAPGPLTSKQWLGGLDDDWIEWHGDIGYGRSRPRPFPRIGASR
jgi:hypothetical protein